MPCYRTSSVITAPGQANTRVVNSAAVCLTNTATYEYVLSASFLGAPRRTRIMVRANRYALAAALNGKALEPWVRALHGCDNPACVRASLPGEIGLLHIIGGSQRDNMLMMARAGRGGGRVMVRRGDHGVKARRARAVALREAVRHGWDAEAVEAALLGSTDPTLW